MAKFIAPLALMGASFALALGSAMYGWGLHPQSWGWIVGAWLGQVALLAATKGL